MDPVTSHSDHPPSGKWSWPIIMRAHHIYFGEFFFKLNSINTSSYKIKVQAGGGMSRLCPGLAAPTDPGSPLYYAWPAHWRPCVAAQPSLQKPTYSGNVPCKTLSHKKEGLLWQEKSLGAKWLLTRSSLGLDPSQTITATQTTSL